MKPINKTEQNIINHLSHMPSPVTIDDLLYLTGISAVNILNALDTLKQKKLILEKQKTGKGVFFFDDKIKRYISRDLQKRDKKKIIKKLIEHFQSTLEESSDKTLVIADLYIELEDVPEGLPLLKTAADILNHSGHKDKAVSYYDHILKYFKRHDPDEQNVQIYLETVLSYILILVDLKSFEDMIAILTRAEKIAEKFNQWYFSALAKFNIAREFILVGRLSTASKVIDDLAAIAQKMDNPTIQRMVSLAKSELLYFQGKIREATEVYDNAIGNLEAFGDEEVTLRMSALIGWFYVISGRISRGMGLINIVREKSNLFQFSKTARFADFMKIHCYFELRKPKKAKVILDEIIKNLDDNVDYFTLWAVNRCKSFIEYSQKNYRKAMSFYKEGNKYIRLLGWPLKLNGWCVESLCALQSQKSLSGELDMEPELERLIHGDDIYTKGFSLRHRAIMNQRKKRNQTTILNDLKKSENYLEKAGAEIELARTRMALGDYYKRNGKVSLSQSYFEKAWRFFSNVDKNMCPEDLMVIMPQEEKTDFILNRVVDIAESLGSIHEIPLFLDKALNVVMDFTLAMRGALFSVHSGRVDIIASRNMDLQFADRDYFNTVKEILLLMERKNVEMIFPDAASGDVLIQKKMKNSGLKSFVCLPAKLGVKTYAYLCLDNRLGDGSFPKNSLPFLKMLCTQIAVGLSNIELYNEMRDLKEQFESEAVFYRQEMGGIGKPLDSIIGRSEETKKALNQIEHVAPMDSSVLILGETGVGKELVAKTIHNLSARKDGPFISVNLSVLPNDLFASELFGHEKGAFTGANERRKGRFELANDGTIFLDEIGDLPANIQVKLLRVLEEGRFERLGGRKQIQSDFRVLAATNKNLITEVEKGRFRQDLYFRLNVFPIHISPLKERKEDIPALTEHFAQMLSLKTKKRHRRISKKELKKLLNYHWPGNVRELKHFIERAIILSDGKTLHFPDFREQISNRSSEETEKLLPLSDIERRHIVKVLNATGWRVNGKGGAAEVLEMKPSTVFFRMRKLGIKRPSPAKPEAIS